jgi:hypothetical protein
MKYWCRVVALPIRINPSHSSEMVSQLLFGEIATELEQQNNWIKIKCNYDNYEGWVEKKALLVFDEQEYKNCHLQIISTPTLINNETNNNPILLQPGSEIFLNSNNKIEFNNHIYAIKNTTINLKTDKCVLAEHLFNTALQYLNAPYLWGGKTLTGIDCSGFTQTVFKINNIKLPRDAYQQAELGIAIKFEDIKQGDVAFFVNENNKITHVGICLNNHEIIHSSGWVKIDTLINEGIISSETDTLTHKLYCIKRYF